VTDGAQLAFTVLGRAAPGGSKRAIPIRRKTGLVRAAVIDANPKSKPWQALVKAAARDRMPPDFELLTGPLALTVDFYFQRPAGHYGSGKNAAKVLASAPRHPAVRPDLTKLVRSLEDAMSGLVWRDDSQIVRQALSKRFGTPERAEVVVATVGAA
jgi:Holliday junction resolvase RusA-like endonuclease